MYVLKHELFLPLSFNQVYILIRLFKLAITFYLFSSHSRLQFVVRSLSLEWLVFAHPETAGI